MPVASAPDVLVLLALRLCGLAEVDDLVERTGVPAAEVDPLLEDAAARGEVTYRRGAFSGWALLAPGRTRVGELLAAELDGAGRRSDLADLYHRFLTHNAELLALCTDWQLRDVGGQPVVNEHDDPDYDRACVERLIELDDKVAPLVADLAELFERFAPYPTRLAAARRRVEAGDEAWFTSPGVDSYHTVWFELHEHLLATLGLERTDERNDA